LFNLIMAVFSVSFLMSKFGNIVGFVLFFSMNGRFYPVNGLIHQF